MAVIGGDGKTNANVSGGPWKAALTGAGLWLRGWYWSGGGLGGRDGGRLAVEGKVLGLVVLDRAEEGVVVSGAVGGDLALEKVDVA